MCSVSQDWTEGLGLTFSICVPDRVLLPHLHTGRHTCHCCIFTRADTCVIVSSRGRRHVGSSHRWTRMSASQLHMGERVCYCRIFTRADTHAIASSRGRRCVLLDLHTGGHACYCCNVTGRRLRLSTDSAFFIG